MKISVTITKYYFSIKWAYCWLIQRQMVNLCIIKAKNWDSDEWFNGIRINDPDIINSHWNETFRATGLGLFQQPSSSDTADYAHWMAN